MDSARLTDIINWVKRKQEEKYTDFLEPPDIKEAEKVLNKDTDIGHSVMGGYKESERNIIAVYPYFKDIDDLDIPLKAVEIRGAFDTKVTHRDVLGSLMGLGIKREKIGDIIVGEDICQVIVIGEIADYIIVNLSKVNKFRVKCEIIGLDAVKPAQVKTKIIETSLASLRLDSVASAAFSLSRTKMTEYLKQGLVSVNWEVTSDNSHIISEGDVISFRGHGRAFLDEIIGKTKKGRYFVSIKRLL